MLLLSPAKLNLFFHVLHKRSDGYHEISSLYQAIDWFDLLKIEKGEEDLLTCTDPFLDCGPSNLISQALSLFRSHFPFSFGIKIHLEKKIPIQAGLGGGSSNAATTLWGLNEWLGRPATLKDLIQMGSFLGSDVPFFFSSGTALCTGRGERCRPALYKPLQGWIAKPKSGLSTVDVYQNLKKEDLDLSVPNHLEAPAFRLQPQLAILKKQLEQMGFSSVVMTGSGTSFICLGGKAPPAHSELRFFPFKTITRASAFWYSRLNLK